MDPFQEYSLSIYSKSQGLLQTLTYTTYGPSSLTDDLPRSPWTRAPDGRYLQSMHDGSLVCFQAGHQGLEWATEFAAPVASVFDVAVSHDADGTQPVVFPQPKINVPGGVVGALKRLSDTAFIGRLDEDILFAMSTEHYPLVAFAPGPAELGDKRGLTGLQRLETPQSPPEIGLGQAPERLGIDAPAPASSSSIPSLFRPFASRENNSTHHVYSQSEGSRSAYSGGSPWATTTSVLVALVLGLFGARWVYGANWEAELDRRLRLLGRNTWFGRHIEQSSSSLPPPSSSAEASSEDAGAASIDGRRIEAVAPRADKDLPPLPLSLVNVENLPPAEEVCESEGESGGDDRDGAVINARRKGRRRKRGRKLGQRAKAEAEAAAAAAAVGPTTKETATIDEGDGRVVVRTEGGPTGETVEDSVGALVVSNSILGKWKYVAS
jgi:hypothetical protein